MRRPRRCTTQTPATRGGCWRGPVAALGGGEPGALGGGLAGTWKAARMCTAPRAVPADRRGCRRSPGEQCNTATEQAQRERAGGCKAAGQAQRGRASPTEGWGAQHWRRSRKAERRRGQHRRAARWAALAAGQHSGRTGTGQRCAARGRAPARAMREAARRRGRGARSSLSTGHGRIARTLGRPRCARWRRHHQQAAAVASRAAHASRTLSSASRSPPASSTPAALSRSSARPQRPLVEGEAHVRAGHILCCCRGVFGLCASSDAPGQPPATSRPERLCQVRGGHPAVPTHQGRCAAGGRCALALALRSASSRRLFGRSAAVLWRRRNTKPA